MTKLHSASRPMFSSIVGIAVLLAVLSNAWGESDDEQIVKDLVDQFLITVGKGDFDALPAMFVSNANIGTATLREGQWVASTTTFAEWLAELKAETTWTRFREPVNEFTVHIEDGQMAFVRADANLIMEGRVVSHNIDYFTLVRDNGAWRLLCASYVARPVSAD
jgi:hypothetical protein